MKPSRSNETPTRNNEKPTRNNEKPTRNYKKPIPYNELICNTEKQGHEDMCVITLYYMYIVISPGRVAQLVGHLTRKSGVLGSIPGLAKYFRFSFRFSKLGSCQLLAKVCARSTG